MKYFKDVASCNFDKWILTRISTKKISHLRKKQMDSNKKKIDVKVSEQFVTKILTGNEIPFTFDTVENHEA